MSPRAWKPCSCTNCQQHPDQSCPEIVPSGTSRCTDCRRTADKARPSSSQRGYANRPAWRRVRARLLAEFPFCQCHNEDQVCDHGERCYAYATVADHHPTTRAELIERGVRDPDSKDRLRALCARCHNRHTAQTSPGGWNKRS